MSVINTNVKSMFAQAALQTNERSMNFTLVLITDMLVLL